MASATSNDADTTTAVPPWLSPTSYWVPTHLVNSAWLTHGSFAAWIMDVLRPRDVVELGTHHGFSCFAFAEAAKRLGHPVTINALDSWEGDDHAGFYGDDVYRSVQEVAERDYPDSVILHRGYFSQTRAAFEPASVDLLHIDGRHGYADVSEDYEQWRDTVREGGVILFHDIAERRDDFGVWRLWEEIAEPGRSFAFEHGHGLGVLAVGDVTRGPLRSLFTANATDAHRIRSDYERLGTVIAQQARIPRLIAEIASLHDVVDVLQADQRRLSDEVGTKDAEIAALRESTSWRVTAPLRTLGRMVRRGG